VAEGIQMPPTSGDTSITRSVERFRGRTLKNLSGEALLTAYRCRGPITFTGGYVCLVGPEANRFVFANSELFSWREAFEGWIPLQGGTTLIVSDGAEHRRRHRLVHPPLHHRQVENYVAIIAETADSAIEQWRPGQRFDIHQTFASLLLRSTLHSLFGRRIAEDEPFFEEQIHILLNLLTNLPTVLTAKRRLATPQWRSAMAARDRLDKRVYAEVERVRWGAADTDDTMLTSLVHGAEAPDDALSDNEVRDQMVSMMMGGYENTTTVMAWAIYGMLSTPGVWDHAAAEVRDVVGDRRPDATDLARLTYVKGVVYEALRLYSSVLSLRYVAHEFEFAGRRVKHGSTLVFSPYVTHRLPELWRDPLAFRPQRWDPAGPEFQKRGVDQFLPFAAGPHRCVGADLATTQLTVMLARLLAQRSLYLPEQRIRPTRFAGMRPAHGLLVDVLG
jgi:cytochrome P450